MRKKNRDYRSRANKAERLFANAARTEDAMTAIKVMRKGISILRKACRKKQMRHAEKYGYGGGLRCALDAAECKLEHALRAHNLPFDFFCIIY